jgi:hypothetical protein
VPHFGREGGVKLMRLDPKTLADENTPEILEDERVMRKQAHSEMALRQVFALHTGNLPDLAGACK